MSRELECHAARDGECGWRACPQLIAYQSHCPIDIDYDDWNEPEKADVARRDAFLLTPLGARVQELAAQPSPSVPPARDSGRDEAREAVARELARHRVAGFSGTEVLCGCSARRWRSTAEHQQHLADAVAALLRDGTTT